MSSILRVAAIQMTSGTSWTDNLKSATDLVGLAHEAGAQVVLLPEYFCLMGQQDDDKVKIREAFAQGPIQDAMSQLAQEHGVYLVSGTIPLLAEQANKVRNSSLVFDPCGKIIARYDKILYLAFIMKKSTTMNQVPLRRAVKFVVLKLRLQGKPGPLVCRFAMTYAFLSCIVN